LFLLFEKHLCPKKNHLYLQQRHKTRKEIYFVDSPFNFFACFVFFAVQTFNRNGFNRKSK